MAPRLSRWIALTAIAAAAVAVTLLTTGGTPIMFLGWTPDHRNEIEATSLGRRIEGVRQALIRVRSERIGLEEKEQIAAAAARTDADPLVLKRDGARLVVDVPATAAVDSLWKTIPVRQHEVRTIIVRVREDGSWGSTSDLGRDGVCVVSTYYARKPADLAHAMGTMGGECLFAEEFGIPGRGIQRWERDVSWRGGISWNRFQSSDWYRLRFHAADQPLPVWFGRPTGLPFWAVGGYDWAELNRLEMACLVGRMEHCVAAAGVGEAGWPAVREGRGNPGSYPVFRNRLLPRSLLESLGPAKFGEIWTSDDPVAVSYARVTGKSMNGWVMQWAQAQTGPILRDNALSLVGWLGALTWIALTAILIAQRLKQRAVT